MHSVSQPVSGTLYDADEDVELSHAHVNEDATVNADDSGDATEI